MTLALDHVVIAVNDLARSVEEYRALGFTVYPGGDHHGRSSHNALMVLAEDRITRHVGQGVVHPAHVPLVMKTQAAGKSGP